MKRKQHFGVNVGTASILLIFIVLCQISLAVLSLSSASADYRLSEKITSRQLSYYEACNKAEEALYTYDLELKEVYDNCTNQDDFYANTKDLQLCFPITDMQSLIVIAKPSYPYHQVTLLSPTPYHYYAIETFKTEITSDITYDSHLPVIQ